VVKCGSAGQHATEIENKLCYSKDTQDMVTEQSSTPGDQSSLKMLLTLERKKQILTVLC